MEFLYGVAVTLLAESVLLMLGADYLRRKIHENSI